MKNFDQKTIKDFGDEWEEFNQLNISDNQLLLTFKEYFDIFPKKYFNKNIIAADIGCGSGRWARIVAPFIKELYCIEPSLKAINVAKKNLQKNKNIKYFNYPLGHKDLANIKVDFAYCLGVLHHTPNTNEGLKECSKLLKKGSPFLLYLYYNFDNKNIFYKLLWKFSDLFRKIICILPFNIKKFICFVIAIIVYFPLAKIAYILDKIKINTLNFPLSNYKNKKLYDMRNDSLDRFGTKIENRFSKKDIKDMLIDCGFYNIKFSDNPPYWTVLSFKE